MLLGCYINSGSINVRIQLECISVNINRFWVVLFCLAVVVACFGFFRVITE